MKLEEQQLSEAFGLLRDRELCQLEDKSALPHRFSEDFEMRMEQLLEECQHPPKRGFWPRVRRRAAAFLLVGLAGMSVCFMSVDAVREKLFRMVEEKHAEFSNISYERVDGTEVGDLEYDLVEYRPAWLPEGMRLVNQTLNSTINWSSYRNAQGEMLSFHQSILGTVGSAINTEGSELEEFELSNGDTAYKMSNMGTQFVLWNDNQYEYMITLSNHTLEDAVRVAESVAVCPPGAPHPPHLEVDMTDLPLDYTPEEALAAGLVVVNPDGSVDNLHLVEQFLKDFSEGEQSIFGLCDYQKGTPLPMEVYFDGFEIIVTVDETSLQEHPEENHRFSSSYCYDTLEQVQEDHFMVIRLTGPLAEPMELLRYEIH